jgi:UDP-N-acetylglucosamine 2-epimerase (non-hydrolysing)
MHDAGIRQESPGVHLMHPQPYMSFLALEQRAAVVITDSGGIQEETSYFGTPCLTVRENTERPITSEVGTNILVGRDIARLGREVRAILAGNKKHGSNPTLWDGCASERIADILVNHCPNLAYRQPSQEPVR